MSNQANPASARSGIAAAVRHVLPNGMVALIHRNPNSPTVSVRGEIRAGAIHEAAEQAGLATFTGAALIRGTAKRSFQQIVAETEARGCSVNAGGGTHSSSFGGKALNEDLPLVLEVLADMLITPAFPAAEVEKLRGQFLMNLRESEEETGYQAARAAQKLLFPPEHPYSRPAMGTMDTVAHISRDDLAAFHQQYHPAATIIAIVGDVDPAAVIADLERFFGAWQSSREVPAGDLPPPAPLTAPAEERVPMNGKVQSDIIWAVHGLSRRDPQYYPAMVGNMILGQLGIGGRLGENIREKQGMAYYAYSRLAADLGAGPWMAVAGVNPANVERARVAILHEIEQFTREGPDEQELADAQDFLTGSLVISLETNDGMAAALLTIERHSLGLDYIDRYPAIIRAVSHEQIVAVARQYLSTERYALVVAGPEIPAEAAQ
jgi:zinc protease